MLCSAISLHTGSPADFTHSLSLNKLALCRTLSEGVSITLTQIFSKTSFLEKIEETPTIGKQLLTNWKISNLEEFLETTDQIDQLFTVVKISSFVITLFFKPGHSFIFSDRFFLIYEYTNTALFTAKFFTYLATAEIKKIEEETSHPSDGEENRTEENARANSPNEEEQKAKDPPQLIQMIGGWLYSYISDSVALTLFCTLFNEKAGQISDPTKEKDLKDYSLYCAEKVITSWKIPNLQELADHCHGVPFYFMQWKAMFIKSLLLDLTTAFIPKSHAPMVVAADRWLEHGVKLAKLSTYLIQKAFRLN